MAEVAQTKASFSAVCVERCGGICCDPWWGIISYPVVKEGGLENISVFRADVLKGIRARLQRITDAYKTSEAPQRPLFGTPEKYNVIVKDIRATGEVLTINLFAFKCRFLSDDKSCSIHPSITGRDIRPPHCGWLGAPEARQGERGYCRIIDDAGSGDEAAIARAIEAERKASAKSLAEGVASAEEAAQKVVDTIRGWCATNSPNLLPVERPAEPGRNDPCWCGSGSKFKRCHGR